MKRKPNSYKMLQYEGVDAEIEAQSKKQSKKKATYLGIGGRVREYKKPLAKLSNSTRDPNEQELRDRPTA